MRQSRRIYRRIRSSITDRPKSFNHITTKGTIKLTTSKKGYRVIDSARSKYPKVVPTP